MIIRQIFSGAAIIPLACGSWEPPLQWMQMLVCQIVPLASWGVAIGGDRWSSKFHSFRVPPEPNSISCLAHIQLLPSWQLHEGREQAAQFLLWQHPKSTTNYVSLQLISTILDIVIELSIAKQDLLNFVRWDIIIRVNRGKLSAFEDVRYGSISLHRFNITPRNFSSFLELNAINGFL